MPKGCQRFSNLHRYGKASERFGVSSIDLPTYPRNSKMNKVLATLIAGLFAAGAYAQTPAATPAKPATPAVAAAPAVTATPAASAASAAPATTATKQSMTKEEKAAAKAARKEKTAAAKKAKADAAAAKKAEAASKKG
jgi:hypothetical protein